MALTGYILFLFILQIPAIFMSSDMAMVYSSIEILLIGVVAIILQKWIHKDRFVDMGFRVNRNAFIGMGIGLLFTAVTFLYCMGLPCWLGLARIDTNPEALIVDPSVPPYLIMGIILLAGGGLGMIFCLFGEELAFRGYLLLQFEKRLGLWKAILLNAVIFGLWHLPAYFTIYRGGAAEEGWETVGIMLAAHGISVIPICILYLTTRELYGVSLYHSLVDVIQYAIIGDPSFGDVSKEALYGMTVLNETPVAILSWSWYGVSIALMLGLCRMVRPWLKKPKGSV